MRKPAGRNRARAKMLLFGGLLVCTAALLATLNSCGGGSATTATPPPPPTSKIQHVVIIFQENRTPDNLFQDPILVQRGADLQNYGINSAGLRIPLTSTSLKTDYDLGHQHNAFLDMCDLGSAGCAMDGADKESAQCNDGGTSCLPANVWFQYIDQEEVAPYFQLAETYTFGDRMFQTNQGPSFPAHQFIISGTSAPGPGSSLFAADNPIGVAGSFYTAGCIAPPAERVSLIDTAGGQSQLIYPCFDHPTLTDELNHSGISWRYYSPSAGIIWNAPNAIQHMCVPNLPPPNGTTCTGPDWVNNVVLNYKQVLTDVQAGQLATVSWVIPNGLSSDHAGGNDGSGPSWVASVVNAIGNSPYWANTAIFIAWDDWGGWYDHVAPPIKNSYEYGFRVPLIVVSPYAKAAYVSHTVHHFGSILKYIEENFNLSSLGYADADADDMSDCFDYNQTPLTFQTINAPLPAQHFLDDKSPPTAPDND
jgi:phospholipase C